VIKLLCSLQSQFVLEVIDLALSHKITQKRNRTYNKMSATVSQVTLEQDKAIKKNAVRNAILQHATPDSRVSEFRMIYHAMQEAGSTLELEVLSGGNTNYSYKVYVSNKPNISLFAKVSFSYALWNPDKSQYYDLERTENEFHMMKTFAELSPDCGVTPYLCEALDNETMLVVTQWSTADEQWVHQWAEGAIDER